MLRISSGSLRWKRSYRQICCSDPESSGGLNHVRGQRSDYDCWAQFGNKGWSYADVLPYFKRSERRIGPGDDRVRGRDGELPITDLDLIHPICEAFIEGAKLWRSGMD